MTLFFNSFSSPLKTLDLLIDKLSPPSLHRSRNTICTPFLWEDHFEHFFLLVYRFWRPFCLGFCLKMGLLGAVKKGCAKGLFTLWKVCEISVLTTGFLWDFCWNNVNSQGVRDFSSLIYPSRCTLSDPLALSFTYFFW